MSWGFTLDPFGTVKEIIESWQPINCNTEKDFEESLSKELENKLKNQKIQKQYGSGRQKFDIVVHNKVPIELKKDIKSTSALQRTIGQLELYLKDWDKLFLVICGHIEHDIRQDLEKYIEDNLDDVGLFEERIILIIKD